MKQAVIAPSMLSLLYPLKGDMPGYSREIFFTDLINEVRVFSVLKGASLEYFVAGRERYQRLL
jgi:hypothetical protein